MTRSIARPLPKILPEGPLEVPSTAWDNVFAEVEAAYPEARIRVHEHALPGAYHGYPPCPVPHYLIEISAEESDLDSIIALVDPRLEELRNKFVNSNINIPVEH